MSRLTLWGISQYMDGIFNDIVVPDECDKQNLIDTIMLEHGDQYLHIQNPIIKHHINNWFVRMLPQFDRMFKAINAEYNPIENYNRFEDWTDNRNLTGKHTTDSNESKSSQTATQDSENNTINTNRESSSESSSASGSSGERLDQVSAFDTSSFSNSAKTTSSNESEDTQSASGTDETETRETLSKNVHETFGETTSLDSTLNRKEDEKNTHTGNIHGNIGVTTSQSMIEAEIELRKFDIYATISSMFEDRFLIRVY